MLVLTCINITKAFLVLEKTGKYWYFHLTSAEHLVYNHTCCIIPRAQIVFSFPCFSVSCSSTHQHLDTDLDTSLPLESFISWLFLLSSFFHSAYELLNIFNKLEHKLTALKLFQLLKQEDQFQNSQNWWWFWGREKNSPTQPSQQYLTVLRTSQASPVKFQISVKLANTFMPEGKQMTCLSLVGHQVLAFGL